MMTFFPTPYPGELFYGVISRYKVWNGILDNKNILRDVYGKITITAGRQLPANFELLLKNVPSNYKVTIEKLIHENTAFKFYTAFATQELAEKVYVNMKMDKGSKIYNTLGLSNNTIKPNNYLKYCSECIIDDRETYGEAYWHLEHQLDGVLICNKHDKVLKVLDKSIQKINRQEWFNLEIDNNMDIDKEIAILDNRAMALQRIYCSNIYKLLNIKNLYKQINHVRELYVEKLIKKGISDNRMQLNQEQLLMSFKGFYGDEYLYSINANFDTKDKYNWVTKICRKHRNMFHPVQHLLMIQFLDIDINEIFRNEELGVKKEKHVKKSSEEIEERRAKWTKLMELYKEETTTSLRKYDMSTYTWLYKHDNRWLNHNLPKRKSRGNGNNHLIDWNKRDEEILKASKVAIKEILDSEGKPERVTVSLIGRNIGRNIGKQLNRLQKTKEFLESNLESVEQFQKRRFEWAKRKCPEMKEWELKQYVGIK